MPYIAVGEENSGKIELYYEDHGSGKPVVLIHGYPFSGRAWEKQVPVLVDAGYRVITYDRRGFGQSSQPWSGYDYDTFAEDLHKVVHKLGLHDFAIAGHSMGGGEVARYLGKYGSKGVTKAVIMSGIPPYLRKAADNPEGVDASVFVDIKNRVAADRPALLKWFCLNFFNFDVFAGKRISQDALDANWQVAIAASPKGAYDSVDSWGTDFRNDLKRIDIPVLVLQGDADRIVPFPNSGKRTAEAIKGSKLVVIKDGPHGIAWTHADEVNRALLDFLGQPSTQKATAS